MSFHLLTYQQSLSASALTAGQLDFRSGDANDFQQIRVASELSGLGALVFRPDFEQGSHRLTKFEREFFASIRRSLQNFAPNDPNTCIFLESLTLPCPALEGIGVKVLTQERKNTYASNRRSSNILPHARGPVKILRGTATTTLVANTYTQLYSHMGTPQFNRDSMIS